MGYDSTDRIHFCGTGVFLYIEYKTKRTVRSFYLADHADIV